MKFHTHTCRVAVKTPHAHTKCVFNVYLYVLEGLPPPPTGREPFEATDAQKYCRFPYARLLLHKKHQRQTQKNPTRTKERMHTYTRCVVVFCFICVYEQQNTLPPQWGFTLRFLVYLVFPYTLPLAATKSK